MLLTPQEQAVLRAAVGRILPADDYPGAWDAGALEYLGRQLDGDTPRARTRAPSPSTAPLPAS